MNWLDKIGKFIKGLFQKQKREVSRPHIPASTLIELPQVYPCKVLLVTCKCSCASEYIGVDLSWYKDKGIGMFFCCVPESSLEVYGETKENEMVSHIIPGGKLLYFEQLGIWDFVGE